MEKQRKYIAIDLKSFFASVECVERGLDALDTNLVVADSSRTEKTICLAVSPSLKKYGLSGRSRLFEVVQRVKEVNKERIWDAKGHKFNGESYSAKELLSDKNKQVSFIIAPPRMGKYMEYSTRAYNVYKKYVSSDDIVVYSIDEVFIDVTDYMKLYKLTARELAEKMVSDVLRETGITATVGIGTNLYLAKIAMDIEAKHMEPNENGARIAELDEMSYREKLWSHKPLTDFWRIGKGIYKRLMGEGLCTMGDIARRSIKNEDSLYAIFGINAELIIDHAWGYEPTQIKDIKKYKPTAKSLSSGQVLFEPYPFEKARLIVDEMAELLTLDLVEKKLLSNLMTLTVGYDIENLLHEDLIKKYSGQIVADYYGRLVPKYAHGTVNFGKYTSSTRVIKEGILKLFDEIVAKDLTVRRINICFGGVIPEEKLKENGEYTQIDMFSDFAEQTDKAQKENDELKKERSRQETVIKVRKKYGKNAILKGINFEEGATTRQRNKQIGGHKA